MDEHESACLKAWYEKAAAAGFIFLRMRRGHNEPPPTGWNSPKKHKKTGAIRWETTDRSRHASDAMSWLRCGDNVGIGCGPENAIVESDTADACKVVAGHVGDAGDACLRTLTPRGDQFLFRGPRAAALKQSQGEQNALPGVDTRAALKGYGMGPGSTRIESSYGKKKTPPDGPGPWHYLPGPDCTEPGDIPQPLVDALFPEGWTPPRKSKSNGAAGPARPGTGIPCPFEYLAGATPGSIHACLVAAVTSALDRAADIDRLRDVYLKVSTDTDPERKFARVLADQQAFVKAHPPRGRKRAPAPVWRDWMRGLPEGLPSIVPAYEGEDTRRKVIAMACKERAGLALLRWSDGDPIPDGYDLVTGKGPDGKKVKLRAAGYAPDPEADPDDPGTLLCTTNDEDGLDRALAFLGYRVRANLRAARSIEVCGPATGGRWIPFAHGIDCFLPKLIHKRCRTRHETPQGGVYYKPLRIAPQVLANWCHANVWDGRSVDPFIEYLDSLPPWDGTPRLVDCIRRVFEHAPDQHRALCEWASGAPLIAACARGLNPGALADTITGLQGPQAIGKSRYYRELFDEAYRKQWYSDTLPLAADDKTWGELRGGKVLVEASEMVGLRRSDQEALKALTSRRTLVYRPAYGRAASSFPLRDVVVATTNDDRALPNDPTGNRRWCLVKVCAPREGGWEWLAANREQLWAEALHRATQGEEGNVPPALAEAQARHNEPMRGGNLDLEDGLEEIADWIDAEAPNTVEVVGEMARRDCLRAGMRDVEGKHGEPSRVSERRATAMEGARRTDRHSREVVRALKAMGWELCKSGARRVWTRPYRSRRGNPEASSF